MTEYWKQHSGAKKNRNVKATSVLMEKSNFWERGSNLELYHDNDGSTTYLGIGTNAPYSRLSFGDSAVQRRLPYANNGNFAFCEKNDGSEATGIGFYERFKSNDPTLKRLFTGLKFVVNKDNNNTMDTSGQNVKLLLRDDGKMILGHDPDFTTALEPYNIAMFDVSGNIRTSNYMILNKVETITGYKPPGAIRYDGLKLIYFDDDGRDQVIKVESDVAATGDWSSGQDEDGNFTVYLQAVPVGILRNLYDQDLFEAEFQVEGRITVGDQAWMKIPIFSGTTIFDVSGDGIMSIQNNIGIHTHEPQAMLDCNLYNNSPWIKCGLDDVDVSGQSVGMGQQIDIKSGLNFVFGQNHTIIADPSTNLTHRSFVMGSDNRVIDGRDATIFGQDNLIHNSPDSSANFIFGINNRIFDCSSGFIAGEDCTLGYIAGGREWSAYASQAMGKENFVISYISHAAGYKNKIIKGNYNTVFGSYNDISGSYLSMSDGSGNYIKDSSGCFAFGFSNQVFQDTSGSFLSGISNTETTGEYNALFGNTQTSLRSQQNLVCGKSNSLTDTTNNLIMGLSNVVTRTVETITSGKNNIITDTSGSAVFGSSNTVVNDTHNSIVSGEQHSESNGMNNAHFGKSVQSITSNNNITSGNDNYLHTTKESVVFGISNNAINVDHSMTVGKDNKVRDASGSMLFGNNNDISGNALNSLSSGANNKINGGTQNVALGDNSKMTNSNNSILSGLNNIATSIWNSVGFGKTNHLDTTIDSLTSGNANKLKNTHATTVFGTENDASNNTTNSFVSGSNNRDYNGQYNATMGKSNYINNGEGNMTSGNTNTITDASMNTTLGTGNTITNNDESFVSGKNNTLTNNNITFVIGESNNVSGNTIHSFVSGKSHTITNTKRDGVFGESHDISGTTNTFTSGKDNAVTIVTNGSIIGIDNIVNNSTTAFVDGSGNIVDNSELMKVIGSGNIVTNTSYSMVKGKNNKDYNGTNNTVFGETHDISNSSYVFINGYDHTVLSDVNSSVMGKENTLTQNTTSFVTGEKNIVKNNESVLVSGENNDVSGNTKFSLITGVTNKENAGYANLTNGEVNDINNEKMTITSGWNNTVKDGSFNQVFGYQNTSNTNSQSFISGKNNSLSNNSTSSTFGTSNTSNTNINSMIVGDTNTTTSNNYSFVNGKTNNTSSSTGVIVSGLSNTTSTETQSFIMGKDNTVSSGTYNTTLGLNNNSNTNTSSFVAGKNNTLSNNTTVAVFGSSHDISVNSVDSFISGNSNKETTGSNNATFGKTNVTTTSTNSLTTGLSNNLTTATNSLTSGETNKGTNITNSIISGKDQSGNTVIRSLMNGENNTASQVTNSFISGKQNSLSSDNYSAVTGFNNTLTTTTGNIVSGDNNTLTNTKRDIVQGLSNQINNSNDIVMVGESHDATNSDRTAIFGYNQTLSGSTNSVISGNTNTETNGDNNATFGNLNQITRTSNSIAGGKSNTITDSSNCQVTGDTNSSNNVDNSITIGKSNSITDVSNAAIFGLSHQVKTTTLNSIVSGKSHIETTGTNNALFGEEHETTSTSNTLSTGKNHTITTGNQSLISGKDNIGGTITNVFVTGESNNISNSTNTSVLGKSMTITGNNNSFLTGKSNGETNGNQNALFGESNTTNNSNNTMVGGKSNAVATTERNITFGLSNNVTNGTDNITIGQSNTVLDTTYSGIIGSSHDISSNTFGTLSVGKSHKEWKGRFNITGGESNQIVNSSNMTIGGLSNKMVDGSNNLIQGRQNDLKNVYNSGVTGKEHTVTNNQHTAVSGWNHTVRGEVNAFGVLLGETKGSIVSGYNHTETRGTNNAIHGQDNTVYLSSNNLVGGASNQLNVAVRTSTNGTLNQITSSTDSLANGKSNVLNGIVESTVLGNSNDVSNNTTGSLVSGKSNKEGRGTYNATFGSSNTVVNVTDTITSGITNRIKDSSYNAVFGETNVVNTTIKSIIGGHDNEITLSEGISVFGAHHAVSQQTKNSLVSGRTNIERGGLNNAVFGNIHDMTSETNSLISGKGQTVQDGSQNAIFGETHNINTLTNTFTQGKSNVLHTIQNSSVIGDTNDVSNNVVNSMIVGKENKGGVSENTVVFGYKNNTQQDKNVLVSGNSNTTTSNNASSVMGRLNIVTDCSDSFIMGANHNVFSNGRVTIYGEYNDMSGNTINSMVQGRHNYLNQLINSAIFGENQDISGSTNLLAQGKANVVLDTNNSVVVGKENKLEDIDEVAIFGSKHDVSGSTIYSLVSGYKNKENNGDYNSTFGTLNDVKNSKASVVTGKSNKDTNGNQSTIMGSFHQVTSSTNTLTQGMQNTVTSSQQSVVMGHIHNESNGTNNVLMGYNQTVSGSNNNLVTGKENTVINSSKSLVAGHDNKEEEGDNNFVIGTKNVLYDNSGAIIGGEGNIAKLNNSVMVMGLTNDISNSSVYSIVGGTSNKVNKSHNALVVGQQGDLKRGINTVLFGKSQNVVDSSNVVIAGESNINLDDENVLVSGKDNDLSGNKITVVFGKENTLKRTNNTLVSGYLNKVEDGSNNSVFGYLHDVSGNSQNTAVFGNKNEEYNGLNNIIGGNQQDVSGAENIFGMGESNKLRSDKNTGIIGKGNDLNNNKESFVVGLSNTVSKDNQSFIMGTSNNTKFNTNNAVFGNLQDISGGVNLLVSGKNHEVEGGLNNMVVGSDNIVTDCSDVIISGSTHTVSGSKQSFINGKQNVINNIYAGMAYGTINTLKSSDKSLIGGANNKIEGGNTNVAIGQSNDISNSIITMAFGKGNVIKNNSNESIALGKLNTIDGVNHGIAVGYKASVSGDTRFALGSEHVDGNILWVNKHGDMHLGRHLYSDVDENKNIFTDLTTSTINVGGDHSKTFIGGTLEVSGNMIAGIDEDKEIFTDVSTNRITIGGGSSTVIVGGDLRVNTNILSQEGSADEDKYIWTDVSSSNIYMGGAQSSVWIGKDLQVANDVVMQGNLTVRGTRTFIHTTNMDISDNVVLLNKGIGQNTNANFSSGFTILRDSSNQFLGWHEPYSSFVLCNTTYDGTGETVGIGTKSKLWLDNIQTDEDIMVGGNITSVVQEDKNLWTDISASTIKIGSSQTRFKLDSNNTVVIPSGTTLQRIHDELGAIRYNKDTNNFEGCVQQDAPAGWRELGSVMDIDKDTYISAEDSHQVDNDQLKFVTAGSERMRIDEQGRVGIRVNNSPIGLWVGGTDAIHVPVGTTAQRPSPDDDTMLGMIRYNSQERLFKGVSVDSFGNRAWVKLTPGAPDVDNQGKVITGSQVEGTAVVTYSDRKKRHVLFQSGKTAIGLDVSGSHVQANVILDISDNGAIRIPKGSTLQRPPTNGAFPNNYFGYIRLNTDTAYNQFEGYNGSEWVSFDKMIDYDRDTYIDINNTQTPGAGNDDIIKFYTGSQHPIPNPKLVFTMDKFNVHVLDGYDKKITMNVNDGHIDMSGNLKIKQDIIAHQDQDKNLWTDVTTSDITIGGASSKVITGGDLQVNTNILAGTDENKEIFTDVASSTIKIGGTNSIVQIRNDLQVDTNIIAGTDENKEIFTDVTSREIKIGSEGSTTVIGGDLQVDTNIVGGTNENKEIFLDVGNGGKTITIGGSAATVIANNNLQINADITAGGNNHKLIYADVTSKTITLGAVGSTTVVAGDLQVDTNIKGGSQEDKEIFTDVTNNHNITIGGGGTTTVIGNKLKVTSDIISATNTTKKIFATNVTDSNVLIGGNAGKVQINHDLEVTRKIVSKTDTNKEIYTGVDNDVEIGGSGGTVTLGNDVNVKNDLKVYRKIISDQDEDKEFYTDLVDGNITMGGSGAASKVIAKQHFQVNADLMAGSNRAANIYTDVTNQTITVGGLGGLIKMGNNVEIGNDITVKHDILTDADESKDIFTGITSERITIGGVNGTDKSTVVVAGDLQVNNEIIGNNNEVKTIFADVQNSDIQIASFGTKTTIKGNLQCDRDITSDMVEDKTIFSNMGDKVLKLGGGKTTVNIPGTLELSGNIITETDEDKEIFKNVNVNNIIIGGTTSTVKTTNDLQVDGLLKAGGNINKTIYSDITSNMLTIGGKTETEASSPGTQTGGSIIKLDSTNSVIIPYGKTSQRTTAKGAIRYNSETLVFEGSDGTSWQKFGDVIDIDKDTFINAESAPGQDEDRLMFVTANNERMVIKNDGKIGVNTVTPAELFDVSGVLQTIDFKVGSITSNTTSDIVLKKSIVPDADKTLNLGSVDKRFNDIFVGEGSMWVGDKHKIAVSNDGVMRLRKRNVSGVPFAIVTIYRSTPGNSNATITTVQNDVLYVTGHTDIGDVTMQEYLDYAEGKTGNVHTIDQIFRENAEDYDEDMPINAWLEKSGNIYSLGSKNVGIATTDPSNILHVVGDARFDNNIIAGSNSDKQFFFDVSTNNIEIGSETSKTKVRNLEIYHNVTSNGNRAKEIFTDVSTNRITIGGKLSTVVAGGHLEVSGNFLAGSDENKEIFTDVTSKDITIGGNTSNVIIGNTMDVTTRMDIDHIRYLTGDNATGEIQMTANKVIFSNDIQVDNNIVAGVNENKEIFKDVSTNEILIGGLESKVKTGGHLEISGNLLGGSDEDKEIMIDVTSKNITIGGPESKVITGGHLEVSGNIISNIDENKEIFFDVSTNYIKFGSGTSIAKFNSSNSIVLPVGTTAEPTLNKGAIRYNNDRTRFEGCTGSKWISLEGVRDVDNNTYIDAESAPEANENRLMFVTDGNNRMVIDHSGNLGLGTTTPAARFNVSDVSNNNRDGLMLSNNATNTVSFRMKASDFNDTENNELLSYSDTGRNIIRLKPKSSSGNGVISLDDKVGLGTTNPSQKLHVYDGNLLVTQSDTKKNALIINPNNHANGVDIEVFQDDDPTIKKKLCLNPYGGNVGVGQYNPTESLDVSGNMVVRSVSSVKTTTTATPEIGTTSAHPFSIAANNIKAITVDTTGKVGLGTQSPDAPLHVTKTTANGEYMRVVDPSNIGLSMSLDTSANDTKVNLGVRWWNNGTPQKVDDGLVLRNVSGTNYVGIGTNVPDKKLDVVGDAIIRGDLTVSGTRTYVNTNNLDISDNVIVLNRGIGSNENTNVSSGILVKRHGNNQFMGWDDVENSFILGETTEEGDADPSGVVLAGKSDLKVKDMNANDIVSTGTITGNNITGANTVLEILKVNGKTPTTHTKTVTAAGGKFYVDGNIIPTLTFLRGDTYVFDQSDTSNSNHPLKFSTTNDGTHSSGIEYTEGVTVSGSAGSAGASVSITISMTAPDTLYYYCGNHSNMGANITLTSPPIPAEIVDLSANKTTIKDLIVTNDLSGNKAKVVDLSATTIEATGDIVLPNPSTSDPQFSLMDLLGAPGSITVTDVSSTAVHIDLDINKIKRYHVGFTPDKLPMVTNLNLKLTHNNSGTITTLLDKAVPASLITSFEDLTKIRISKQNKPDTFSGGIASIYRVTGLTNGQNYELVLSFSNYHPNKNETTHTQNLFVTVPTPPAVQNVMTVNYPINNTQGSTSSTVYLVGTNPQIGATWSMPANTDGDVDKYYIEYEIVQSLSDNSTGSAVTKQIPEPVVNNITCLTTTSQVNVLSSGGNKYVFNNGSTYDSNEQFGLYNGTYTFTNVPSGHPIAILNSGNSNITYTGDDSKKSTKSVSSSTNDGIYDFYYGDVTVTVSGDFGTVSVYCYYHGYMGGENLLTYSNTCASDYIGPYYSVPSNVLSLTLADGIKYGAKYKYRVKAGNDAGATADYGNYTEANFFTVVPSLPPKSRIDNVSIKPLSWTSAQQYDMIDATAFTGGTDGMYATWNGSSFTDYDDTQRKLLRQSYFASNTLDLLDITGINCSTTAGQKPTAQVQYVFTAKIWNGTSYQNSGAVTYSSITDRSAGQTQSVTSGASRLQVKLVDEHPNETASHKTGHWLRADITNIKFQLPNSVNFGSMAIQADVPGVASGFDYATVDFASDPMNTDPTISNVGANTTWIGIEAGAAVTWICGVASLNNGTKIVLQFKAANLASSVAGYYRGDYLQLDVTSAVTNDIEVYGDDGTYGIAASSTNDGNEIEYNNFTYDAFTIGGSTAALGNDVSFDITAHNIHGSTTVTKTKKIIRDLASINSGLHAKRYKAWSGSLAHNNVAGAAVAFDNTIALESHELLFFGGEITTTNTDYKDYRVLYNQQINNNTITNTSVTNTSWAANSTSYRYALYKLPNTVHFAGTGSFGIKFTTDGNGNAFTSGSGVESDFELNLLLPSMINSGTPYWFNGNEYYQSEATRNTGTGSDGVTGLGIFDSKTRLNSYTTFKVTPPVPQTTAQQVNDIWIRVGFKANKNINISNIELVST
tara:strand:- start:3736 stop:22587 length:18852 start_codon:yes stop_codon:yes gene_type:complete